MKLKSLQLIAVVLSIEFLTLPLSRPLFAQMAQSPQSELDDQQLRSFAKVYVQVEKIRQTYEPRAKGAASSEEGKEIQQEAQAKFHDALSKEALTEEKYVQIFEVARANQDVRKRILQMIVEERGKS